MQKTRQLHRTKNVMRNARERMMPRQNRAIPPACKNYRSAIDQSEIERKRFERGR